MRIANVNGRAAIVVNDHQAVDIGRASQGKIPSDPQALLARWDEFTEWALGAPLQDAEDFSNSDLRSPAPAPRQIFAIGVNYALHAKEAAVGVPKSPTVFTKFVSCITGPFVDVELPVGGHVDWEVEIVAIIGKEARNVSVVDAWKHVAGLALGQDISERVTQLAGPIPQFSLGKSFANFGPVGPWLVTTDELQDPDSIDLGCAINGETMQESNSSQLVHSIPTLVSELSRVIRLYPGDMIFTGTPSGVGLGRQPQRWLKPGDVLTSWAEGLGSMSQVMIQAEPSEGALVPASLASIPE